MKDRLKPLKYSRLSKAFIVSLLVVLTACGKEDPQEYIREGKSLFEKGEMESARVQFQNALQIQPKLSEAYYGLALIDEKKQAWPAMFAGLQEAVGIDPNHLDAQIKLGQLFMLSGQLDKAKEQSAILLKLDPENINVLIFEGSLRFREGNKTEAMRRAEQAITKDENNVDAIGLKSTILLSDKRYDEALAVLNKGIESHPGDVGVRLLKIRLHTELNKQDEVVKDFDELIEKHPHEQAFRYAQVDFLSSIGRTEQAEGVLRDAMAKEPSNVDLKLKLISYIERRDQALAETTLKDFIAANQQEIRLKSRLAEFYSVRKRSQEEQATLKEIVAADPTGKDGLTAKVRLAEIAWAQGDMTTAGAMVDEVINVDGGNSEALMLRAGIRLDKKDTDGAISDLRIVLRDQPNSDRAMVMMAQAHVIKSEPELAETHWRKAIEINPGNLSALIPLTSQLLKREDTIRAEDLLSKALKASPGSPEILELLVQVKASKQDWAGVEAAISDMKKLPMGQVPAKLWGGELAFQRQHYDEAIGNYKEVLAERPDMTLALIKLARVYEVAGRRQDLNSYLKTFIQNNPNIFTAYDILASSYTADQRWDEAEKLLRDAAQKDSANIDFKLKHVSVLERRDEKEAEALLKEFIAANPKEARFKSRLAGFYAGRKRYPEAETILKELVASDPTGKESLVARIRLAEMASIQNDLSTAASITEEVLKLDPVNPDALMLRAGIRLGKKEIDGAIADLQQILQSRANADRAMMMLAQAYLQKGQMDAAQSQWQKALEVNPGNMEALVALTSQLIKQGKISNAEELLNKGLKANPDNAQILEIIVQVRASKKDWSGAQAALDALKKLPQTELNVQMLSGMLAMNQGRYLDAVKNYKEILSKKPAVGEALAALAQAYDAAGRRDELIGFLKAFIQKNPGNITAYNTLGLAYYTEKKWDDAIKTLLEALTLDPKSLSTYRVLAGVYTQQGKSVDVPALYKKGLAALPDNPILMMELAKHYEQTKLFDESIALYDSLVSKYPNNDEAINNLADLLANKNNDPEGLKRAISLVERFKDSQNPYFLDTYGWVLFKSGQVDKSIEILKKAVSNAPDNAAIRYHLGAAYHSAGNKEASAVELEKSLTMVKQQGEFNGIENARELLKQVGKPEAI